MIYFDTFSVYPLMHFNQVQTTVALLPYELGRRIMAAADPAEQARRAGAYILLEKMIKKYADGFKTTVEGIVKPEFGALFDSRSALQALRYDSYGKPYFEGHDNVAFNLSHSGNMVACALSILPVGQIAPAVGVDLQLVSPDTVRAERVSERYFTEGERIQLSRVAADGPSYCRLFAQIWTKKEALLKCLGVGLSKIGEADSENPARHGCSYVESTEKTLTYTDINGKEQTEAYYLTVCAQNEPPAPSVF